MKVLREEVDSATFGHGSKMELLVLEKVMNMIVQKSTRETVYVGTWWQ